MLKTFPLSFTDAFGVPHPAAVAMVSSVNQQASMLVSADGVESAGYAALTYQVRFWHNEAARVAGAQSQMFTLDGMMGVMTLAGDAALLPSSDWTDACRAHFEAVVAPTLKPAESAS